MDRKVIKWILGFLVLGFLIAGAVIGYRKLSPRFQPGNGGIASAESREEEQASVPGDGTEPAAADETPEAGETVTVEPISPDGKNTEAGTPEAQLDGESSTETGAETSAEEPETFIAPDFAMTDNEGSEIRLEDYFDKPAVLNFWASWCPPCRGEMPYFDKAYQQYGDQIHFIFVDLTDGSRETEETARQFIEEQGYSFPICFDTTMEGAYTYGVNSIPMTFFMDKGGVLRAYRIGALTEEMLFGELEDMAQAAQ